MKRNPKMRVCLRRKRILLTHSLIQAMGSPTHLCFWYDGAKDVLIVMAAAKDDLDAFEIPAHFWKSKDTSCEVSRIAFLTALQHRLGWKEGYKYSFVGTFEKSGDIAAAIFDLTSGAELIS